MIILILVVLLIVGPSIWVWYAMKRHGRERRDLPGTGGELAIHLINRFKLEGVNVEQTQERGDHYSPDEKMVRLSPSIYQGRSLTAVAVAAHEVGHAIQFIRDEKLARASSRYKPLADRADRISSILFWLIGAISVISHIPHLFIICLVIALLTFIVAVVLNFLDLPLEWDASFGKALPILITGDYVQAEDIPAIKSVLRAAAFTYLARSMLNIVNLGRWLALLLRVLR